MINISKEQLEIAQKALDQIGKQVGKICVNIQGFCELFNILGELKKEISNE